MSLTISFADEFIKCYFKKTSHSEEDDFKFIECLEFLIHETSDPEYMMILGGYYYEHKQFDLAEDYYLMAAELNYPRAYSCLGYIYYYGRTNNPDYKKAFEYFKKSSECGDITSSYKLADMYRNGYYVNKDYDKYAEIIKGLYPRIKDATNLFDPLPEIFSRLAKIYKKEGNISEAVDLLYRAKDFQAQRLQYSDFFGDLTIMKYIIYDLYDIEEFDNEAANLFDLYYVLKFPCKVIIYIDEREYIVEAIKEGNNLYIVMDGTSYEDVDDFFSRVTIEGKKLSTMAYKIDYVEIVKWK